MIMSWNTTNKCNMYCKHCYREAGIQAKHELNTVEGKSLIEEVAKAGFKIMVFSGGEPLVRPDIYELIKHAVKVGLRPVLGSNGTLITKRAAMELKDAGVMGIGISLDSLNPKKHDEFRSYIGGWREAVIGMKNCREAGLNFQIHTTVMNWNKDEILDITDFAIGMGAVAHHTFFLVPTGRGADIEEESLNPEQYESLLKDIMLKQKDVNIELKPTCAPEFMRIAKEMGMKPRFSRGCLAGTSYCIISPSGDVQPCAYLNIPIGNVRETPFSEIWRDNHIFKELRTMNYKGKCGSCNYKKDCGGCRARVAYYNDGDYMAGEDWCSYSNDDIGNID
ncbi:putative heme d1 biosynthesis radical SAM protein NirJ2 [Clostridium estertheticum]|uniref:Putative heme d1 biosynthesis radical SAM protein NirJ2 n=2 Tax=Clostridium estertheticum TaxID=238834 RepID=A0A1J0GE74_9CLOT|nr:putative heme d1 biosynthesis radical SAM protein NirJ2 [Clostridium estertheticum]APC39599.1 putative heme d1 biosynthesis radical SAM protein NirJ2 [Clostridium estertheticum subsp. estertheticum]MBU3072284.1 putative heme d1 biosynthesis radical SAM protein NirJ2 [Clostridium estertheticum]MBU3162376.1 putative heme d1 biosynthesis radical SAM protein NirJ2 [Clostridium estertheticum]MBU3184582.1 putative heme d1 biosynthesis radical SAM protein NirJ2 [Clostridium estertheticum]MBZ961436